MNNNYGKKEEDKCDLGNWREDIRIIKPKGLFVSLCHMVGF
jgi:hypothetical protein